MSWTRNLQATLAVFATLASVTTAAAQCVSADLDEYAVGLPLTTQLDGVFFSVVGQSCDGDPALYNRIADEFYGDSFSSNVLLIDTGCPDFSDDYMRMVFADSQNEVRFMLGPWAGTYQVRVYDTASGGTLIEVQSIVIPGTGFVGVHHPVQVTTAELDIRRIEIEAAASGHEAIDNLRFGMDDTPPEVQIDDPAPLDCITGEITLIGIVCDEDGAYDRDRLESMRVWPNPETDWTLVREFIGSQVCESYSLYAWDTTEAGIIDGVYVLRVTAINECGLHATEEVTVYVDNDFDSIDLQGPDPGAIVGGTVCFEGTAWDRTCFDHYVVQYRPAAGGPWLPVDSTNPVYTETVTNDPLASWPDTHTLPDGDYFVALAGYTTTGASSSQQIALTLDNTPPTAQIDEPFACAKLDGIVEFVGTAYDEHLYRWELEYWDPTNLAWVDITPPSTTAVLSDTLATWDTSTLPPCYYAVRLRVWDDSIIDICDDVWRHRSDYYVAVAIGDPCPGDLDGDGGVGLADLQILLAAYGSMCN